MDKKALQSLHTRSNSDGEYPEPLDEWSQIDKLVKWHMHMAWQKAEQDIMKEKTLLEQTFEAKKEAAAKKLEIDKELQVRLNDLKQREEDRIAELEKQDKIETISEKKDNIFSRRSANIVDLRETNSLQIALGPTASESAVFSVNGEEIKLVTNIKIEYDAEQDLPVAVITVLNPKFIVRQPPVKATVHDAFVNEIIKSQGVTLGYDYLVNNDTNKVEVARRFDEYGKPLE